MIDLEKLEQDFRDGRAVNPKTVRMLIGDLKEARQKIVEIEEQRSDTNARFNDAMNSLWRIVDAKNPTGWEYPLQVVREVTNHVITLRKEILRWRRFAHTWEEVYVCKKCGEINKQGYVCPYCGTDPTEG